MDREGKLNGKVALIAGAGSGIGRAAAIRLAAAGAGVACADIDAGAASSVAAEITAAGGRAIPVTLDVTGESSWAAAIERCDVEFGRIDIVVNSAGISSASSITDTTRAEWRRVMAVNLDGAFLGTRAAVAYFRSREIAGSIVNVSSASGVKPSPGASAYSTSKAGVIMLSKVVAKECMQQRDGIRVNVLSPAGVKTPLWSSMPFFRDLVKEKGSEAEAYAAMAAASGVERLAEPSEVAEAIAFLVSDDSRYVTGANLVIDAGYTL